MIVATQFSWIILLSCLNLLTPQYLDFPVGYPPIEWVHIDDSHFWIYGAFWDNRPRDIPSVSFPPFYVRLYISGPYRYQKFVTELSKSSCEFTFPDASIHKAPIYNISPPNFDWQNPRSQSIHFYIYCSPPLINPRSLPTSVSIVTSESYMKTWRADLEGRRRKFLLPLRRSDIPAMQQSLNAHIPAIFPKKLALCAKPFYGNWASFRAVSGYFDPEEAIINFFIYYSSVGVEHFILYDQGTTTSRIYSILNILRDANISIEVLPWNFHERYGYGMFQTLSIETCIHRCLGRFENVIVGDFDELIVPKQQVNLLSMINTLDKIYPNASHYKFRSVNFYSFLPDTDPVIPKQQLHNNPKNLIIKDLYVLRKLNRTVPFPYHRGTKCIVKPHRISEAGIHDALPLNKNYQTIEVPFDIGSVHHYRDSVIDPAVKEDTSYRDTVMLNFLNLMLFENPVYKILKIKGIL